MTSIRLPRTTVNHILHHAQEAAGKTVSGFVMQQTDREFVSYPISTALSEITSLASQQKGELFAVYSSALNLPQLADSVPVYLSIVLNTKGVLELIAYHCVHGKFEPCALELM
jgi:hypothetical protein